MNLDDLNISGDLSLDISSDESDSLILDLEAIADAEIDISEEEFEFYEADLSVDSEESLSDAVLLSSTTSVVDTLKPYARLVGNALCSIYPTDKESLVATPKWDIDYAEFKYMPRPVFAVMCGILRDTAMTADSSVPISVLVQNSLDTLLDATGWTPTINREVYEESYGTWLGKYRKLIHTTKETPVGDISSVVSRDDMLTALRVFNINTSLFTLIDNFVEEPTNIGSPALLDLSGLGSFTQDYMEANKLKNLAVKDAYDAMAGYVSSPEVISSLGITQDDALSLSFGELVRRLIVYEFDNGFFCPYELRGISPSDYGRIIEILAGSIRSESVVAELLYLLALCIYALDTSTIDNVANYMRDLANFLQAALEDVRLVHPVFYTKIVKEGSTYTLSYIAGSSTRDAVASGVLCEVVGNKTSTYLLPGILFDGSYTICPPQSLVNMLRANTRGARVRVSGNMAYRYIPAISLIAANNILAEEREEDINSAQQNLSMQTESSGLLQLLIGYDNKFDTSIASIKPIVVEVSGYHICAIGSDNRSEAARVTAVTTNNELVACDGTLLFDEGTGNLIASFQRSDGTPVDIVAPSGDYTEMYLGNQVDSEDEKISYFDFLGEPGSAVPVDFQNFRDAVAELCGLASLDYSEELASAKRDIACFLFYLLDIPVIDDILSSRLLEVHIDFARNQGKVDSYNAESMRDLLSVICGKPNKFDGVQLDLEQVPAIMEILQSKGSTIESACAFLDSVDFDTLALLAISQEDLAREAPMDVYETLCYIPEIGSRLAVLEDKFIVMHVFDVLGEQSSDIFSKRPYMVKVLNSQLTNNNVAELSSLLVSKSKKKSVKHALPLCSKLISSIANSDAAVLKYFILERKLYGLLSTMATMDKYSDFYAKSLDDLGIDSLDEFDSERLMRRVGTTRSVKFFNDNKEFFNSIVIDGLYTEAASHGLQIVKCFDLFNAFYDLIVPGAPVQSTTLGNREVFYSYVGSFVLSYCPLMGTSVGGVDGGEDRIKLFTESRDDFYHPASLAQFLPFRLSDIRYVEGDEM